jgi:hypothetical protein
MAILRAATAWMRRPRLSIRALMTAVAIVAVLISTCKTADKRQLDFEIRVLLHSIGQTSELGALVSGKYPRLGCGWVGVLSDDRIVPKPDVLARRVDHHTKMLRKYQFAARFPLLPVLPDPPAPE